MKRDAAQLKLSKSGKGVNLWIKDVSRNFTAPKSVLEKFVMGEIDKVEFAEFIRDEQS